MRKLLSCTMLAVFALTLGVLAGACDGGGGGDDCLSHAECITAHGANWFCNPLTFTCECNSAAACVGKCGGSDGCGGTCANTCVAPQTCNATTFVCGGGDCQTGCAERECGADPGPGCTGLSCGTCTVAGENCMVATGQCEVCTDDCGARECGNAPNGCGTCGTCGANEICAASGMCQPSCTPVCGARECGPDPQGCGTSCGTCTGTDTCNASGVCESACTSGCGARECGVDPSCPLQTCGTCTVAGESCTAATGMCDACTPQCGTRVCGPDPTCQSSCGTCGANEWCDAAGACQTGACVPNCTNPVRECGNAPNCTPAQSCGTCTGGEVCDATGTCQGCTPQCGARECGMDPVCGTQSCGTCTGTDTCNASGMCETQGTGQQNGEPCDFDTVNVGSGECVTGLLCLGMAPNAETAPCTADGDCAEFMDALWNADCVSGGCGASFCVDECVAGGCPEGYAAQTVSGTCYCIPSSVVTGDQQVGEPCDFDTVNVGAGACATGLTCLGVPPDAATAPCTADGDCAEFMDALWNADCVSGGCGASFCSAECVNGACDTGFAPQTVSGVCLCVPSSVVTGDQLPGEPCAWDTVNADAGNCVQTAVCLGNLTTDQACTTDQTCIDLGFMATYNPDCVGGFCGFSFCSAECVNGACGAGFEPQTVSGVCYCVPAAPAGDGQVGDICDDSNLCASGLDCVGTQTSLSFCTPQCDCEAGTGCTSPWECMWSDGAATPTCWCGLPCPSETTADCPNTVDWTCSDIGEAGSPFFACFPVEAK